MSSSQAPALLPLLYPYALAALRHLSHRALSLYHNLFSLLAFLSKTSILSPLSYILAPLTTFASILFSVAFRVPFSFTAWLLDALFPLYVFCGVACIVGALLGYCGRLISLNMIKAVTGGYTEEHSYEETKKDMEERSAKRRRVDKDSGKVKLEGL
jgi:hypothetical protein